MSDCYLIIICFINSFRFPILIHSAKLSPALPYYVTIFKFVSKRNVLYYALQAGEMASLCGYRASSILAEIEIEPDAVIIKKEEAEEEKVDAFGRLIGRKVAVLENRRRSKCIEGLCDRELKRRKRLEQWCIKLGLQAIPADLHGNRNTEPPTTSTAQQKTGCIGIPKIKQEDVVLLSELISDSR